MALGSEEFRWKMPYGNMRQDPPELVASAIIGIYMRTLKLASLVMVSIFQFEQERVCIATEALSVMLMCSLQASPFKRIGSERSSSDHNQSSLLFVLMCLCVCACSCVCVCAFIPACVVVRVCILRQFVGVAARELSTVVL